MSRASCHAPWIAVTALDDMPDDVTPDARQAAVVVSSDVLYNLTGQKWPGIGTALERPLAGCDGTPCFVAPLARRPSVEIVEVKIAGDVIEPTEYELRGNALYRLRDVNDQVRCWPSVQDFSRPAGDDDTWSIEHRFGAEPPAAGATMATELARELARAFSPNAEGCRLGAKTKSLARQGVAQALDDPLLLFRDGATGLRSVDLWISSVNRGDRQRQGAVISVSTTHHRQRHGRPRPWLRRWR